MSKKEKARARARAFAQSPEGRVRVAARNAELSASIRGQGFDERLLRHNVKHRFGVGVTGRGGYVHNGRMVWA